MTSTTPIQILIADDHPIVLQGLSATLNRQPGMTVVAEATDGREAVEMFRTHQPDVTLMDLRMPQMSGVEALRAIRNEFPAARAIILTTYDTDEDIYRGLQAGARAYLLKNARVPELVNAIRTVHLGRKYIPTEVGTKLAERVDCPQLSNRERDILALMVKGMNNQAIGKDLQISEGTVKYHINNILSKLGASSRTSAVVIALKRGIANL